MMSFLMEGIEKKQLHVGNNVLQRENDFTRHHYKSKKS